MRRSFTNMAVDELTPFLQLGPFLGVDNSTAQPYVAAGTAVFARNCNTYRNKSGLTPERGRIALNDFGAQFSQINVLTYIQLTDLSRPALLMQGLNTGGSGLFTCVYDIIAGTLTEVDGAVKYTQAIQLGDVVYTNGGQRLFVNLLGTHPQMYTWQYTGFITVLEVPSGTYTITGTPLTGQYNNYNIGGQIYPTPQNTGNTVSHQADSDVVILNEATGGVFHAASIGPPGVVTIFAGPNGNNATTTTGSSSGGDVLTANQPTLAGITTTSPTGGMIPEETRFYVTTQITLMPDGTYSETSPENYPTPFSIVSGPGNTNSNTLTLANPAVWPFTGLNHDGTTFTTNIYAQSSLQAGYFLVGNAATNAPFVDTLSDSALAINTPLFIAGGSAFQRDPPPVGITTFPPSQPPLAGVLNKNYAFMAVFNSCVFILTHIDTTIIEGSPSSTQLWYSQAGIPWEFSSDTRALLLQDEVENFLADQTSSITPSFQYQSLYGDYAKGLAVCGTVLVAWKHREMWLVYGSGSDIAPFQQVSAFNVGAQSLRSITPCIGGAFVKTEGGVYFFNGQTPQYDETNFTTVNANAPYNHGIVDDVATVGAYKNFAYILSYPTLNKSYVFNTLLSQWMGELPYAAFSQDAVAYMPSDPSLTAFADTGEGSGVGVMLAVRASQPTTVDFWFADDANDLGTPTVAYWEGPESDAPGIEFRKSYEMITVFAPHGPGTCTVKLSIDGRTPPYLATFDLSAPRPLIQALPRPSLGFSAKLSVELQGIPGEPAPQVWKVSVWGKNPPTEKLARPQ